MHRLWKPEGEKQTQLSAGARGGRDKQTDTVGKDGTLDCET